MAGAGRKIFTRERATTSDVQNYLMDQTVMVFASASARATGLGAPSEGMHTYLSDVDRLDYWNGSSWVAVPLIVRGTVSNVLAGGIPPVGTKLSVLAYTVIVGTNANGDSTHAYPAGGFPNGVLSVSPSSGDLTAGNHAICVAAGSSLTAQNLNHRQPSGAACASVNVRANVIAVGW